jgi:hypothetical protein
VLICTSRPSNARIHKLEEENARLRDQLCSKSPELRSVHSDADQGGIHFAESPNAIDSTHTLNSISDETLQAKAQVIPPSCHLTTGQPEGSAFHGPSSGGCGATHIGTVQDRSRIPNSDEFIKNQLLAETARQRESTSLDIEDLMLIQIRSTRKGQPQSREA